MKWISNNLISLIVLLVLIWLGLQRCNDNSIIGGNNKPQKPDTVYSSHTEYIQQPPVYIPQYMPVQTASQQPIIIPSQYKPDTSLNGVVRQYTEVLMKYLAKNNYVDSIVLKDSTGKRVGVVGIEDQISENKLVSRKPSYSLQFPTIYNTTTITNYPKPKRQMYIGGIVEGTPQKPLKAGGLGLLYKNRKDAMWGITGKYDFQYKEMNYGLSRYFKLSF